MGLSYPKYQHFHELQYRFWSIKIFQILRPFSIHPFNISKYVNILPYYCNNNTYILAMYSYKVYVLHGAFTYLIPHSYIINTLWQVATSLDTPTPSHTDMCQLVIHVTSIRAPKGQWGLSLHACRTSPLCLMFAAAAVAKWLASPDVVSYNLMHCIS